MRDEIKHEQLDAQVSMKMTEICGKEAGSDCRVGRAAKQQVLGFARTAIIEGIAEHT